MTQIARKLFLEKWRKKTMGVGVNPDSHGKQLSKWRWTMDINP